jgi:uncharacterized protein YndB with AHSA1/START domain
MRRLLTAAIGILVGASPAAAAVRDAAPGGFVVVQERQVAATPAAVFDRLMDVAAWWDPDHTYSGSADNLSMEPGADGCFCETLPGGGRVRHMTVAYVAPGTRLRLTGGLGPLQQLAVTGSMTFDLEAADGGTALRLTYRVAGWDPDGLEALSKPVDLVLGGQLDRLVRLVETGSPVVQARP